MKPLLLHYYLTNRCNSRCTFCSIWQEEPKIDAQETDVIRNLYDAKKIGCSFVDFTGGEPLLHKHLPRLLFEAKRLGYITSVTTNCLLFPKLASSFNGLIDLLHFSIDADSSELHDKIRGVKSFDAVMQSIDAAIENNLFPDLLFTYSDENIDNFNGIYELALKKRLILILDPLFNTEHKDSVSYETHQKAISYSRRKGVYLNLAHISLRNSGGNQRYNPLCRAVDSTIVILPDNTLALPCFHHCFEKLAVLDNLTKAYESSERMAAKKNQGRYKFCEGCHINCYFDPTFTYLKNRMFLQSVYSKIKYSWTKYLVYARPNPFFTNGNRFYHKTIASTKPE